MGQVRVVERVNIAGYRMIEEEHVGRVMVSNITVGVGYVAVGMHQVQCLQTIS